MKIDLTVLRVKVEDPSAFAAAVTAEHVIAKLDIHVGFSICAEWTPAMQLRSGISYDVDPEEIHYLLDITRQIGYSTHLNHLH